ncbi:sensor histidine kinase [Geoalkalibacter halelectricus]|uniref:histidine kinase n=1 Tax=Geoalkalibacter halelectricus TaxID=2847045 RepID=A0ABY5ZNZ3_9BACT|nr:ATP-binding protein [Geoalkalibacter halelectricus]MDO3377420.1 ATP-binding protein [Geoalkalibacter halelectricus]UWZ80821.1 ATP-binding protein [Geoalkalibacter halelectricus]
MKEDHQAAGRVAGAGDMGPAEAMHRELEKAQAALQQFQARILQQEKMAAVGQLAAGVAHEINNPVGFITSNLHSLAKYLSKLTEFIAIQEDIIRAYDAPQAAARLDAAKQTLKIDFIVEDIGQLIAESLDGAGRVSTIVQGLKSFSRASDNEMRAVDLVRCLESTLSLVWNEIKFKAEVVRDYQNLPPVFGCEQQLAQVFMNLLVNAAQAIAEKGRITLRTRCRNGRVCVSISDSGCGIAPEVLARLFEPFFTTKAVGEGTGLGLSISREIVAKHGGELHVTSEPGCGTTFTVDLPQFEEGEHHP